MELSVLIVNYNAEPVLRDCLDSVYRNTVERPLEVLVVDNASSDGSLAMLAREFPEVRVIASQENLGFSRGNNLAIQAARGRYLLLLNNDTRVTPGALDTLLRLIKARPDVGALGPLLRNADGSVQISYGRMIGFRAELLQKLLFALSSRGNPLVGRYLEWRARREAYPDWVSGACILLRTDVLRQVGPLDENFFMYTEEVDLCHRIRNRGYRVLYSPEAEIVHLGGKSTESNSEKAALEYRRSQLYFYLKHYGRGRVRLLKAYLLPKTALAWVLADPARRDFNHRLLRLVWDF